MKNLKKVIAVILCIITVFSVVSITASAANYTNNYVRYSAPANSGDYAYWNATSKKVVKSSSTTANEIRWMQAALNYCRAYEGLSFKSTLDVDGSFGPASKEATIAFQRAVNVAINNRILNISKLTVDGSFGPATIIAMKKVLNDSWKTFSVVIPTRTTTSTSTTSTSTSISNQKPISFTQQNILQVNANSSSEYMSGNWYTLKRGNCTCGNCGNLGYGDHEYIQGGGCGIVSLVSAIYNLGGTIDKSEIGSTIEKFLDWGYNTKSGSQRYWQNGIKNRNFFNKADDKFGTTYSFTIGNEISGTSTDTKLINHIKNGGTAVVHVYSHFMAIVDYKEENGTQYFRVFDPAPGGGTKYNSTNRKTADGKAITTASGNWFTLEDLKNDGGTKGKYKNSKGNWVSYGYENIEIDAYWLVSKK